MILKLENTTTHQIFEYEVEDKNYGEKLYFRFDINTLPLEDGEYSLTLYDGEEVVTTDLLRIENFDPQRLQYKSGNNTYISIELDSKLGSKKTQINEITSVIYPDNGYDGMTDVTVDATPIYEIGKAVSYDEGYTDGVESQKEKLESINITENGIYSREDGFSTVTVDVPDLNGAYDDGYTDGYADGTENGLENAGSIIAETAQELDITENGIYLTKYADDIIIYPDQITGDFGDGTYFYDCAYLRYKTFDTNMFITNNTTIEFWFRYTNEWEGDSYHTIMSSMAKDDRQGLQIRSNGNIFRLEIGSTTVDIGNLPSDSWTHFLVKQNEGLYVNGELKGTLNISEYTSTGTLCINGTHYNAIRHTNGYYGMVKISDQIFIPTKDGFINYNTQTPLDVLYDGAYIFTEYPKRVISGEGNLIKSVIVNVSPRINVAKEGLKFSYSSFKKIPEWLDWSDITSMYRMFYYCSSLTEIPNIDTSKVFDMSYMFNSCSSLKSIPQLDTSKVTNMSNMFTSCSSLKSIPQLDTSKVTNMSNMFTSCSSLVSIPQLDTSNVTNMTQMFSSCISLISIPPLNAQNVTSNSIFGSSELTKLTDFGGLIGLKVNFNGSYAFNKCPNLTYESCINILNGLYDFRGNGDTSTTRTLKVHSNFLTKVGDEVSIGTDKGWIITT